MGKRILGLCIAALLAAQAFADSAVPGVQTVVLAKTISSWDGTRLPDYPAGTPEITILRISIPPGVQLPRHKHPVINAAVLLSGTLTVVADDNKTKVLRAGDALVELVNQGHYGRNDGDRTAEILVFYAGIVDTPITIKETPLQ